MAFIGCGMTGIMMRLIIILIGFFNWNMVIALQIPSPSINISKRIDVPLCTERFDVHRDTIIQTEDSRKMGASFLYSVEMNNRDECLRLCCETDRCDVFVFEEKYMGSCFLFQCGPPDDFRCQFAAHANYSIAVLSPTQEQRYRESSSALSKTPPPAPSMANTVPVHLSQHEQELVRLKTGRESFGTYRMPEMGKNNVAAAANNIGPIITATTTVSPSSPCGRFQFRCHSGECIAIYNVCDGISQCEDGSDETSDCPSQQKPTAKNNNRTRMEEVHAENNSRPNQHSPSHGDSVSNDENGYPGMSRSKIANSNLIGNYNKETSAIERTPFRNREDPVTAPRYYPSIKQQDNGHSLQIQYNMNNDPDNRQGYEQGERVPPNSRVPVDYYSQAGIRDKYYFASQPIQPNQLQPVIVPQSPASSIQQQQTSWQPSADGLTYQNHHKIEVLNYLPNNNNENNWSSINNNLLPNKRPPEPVGNADPLLAQLPNGPLLGNHNNWPVVSNSQSAVIVAAPPPPVIASKSEPASSKPKVHRKEEEGDSDEEDEDAESEDSAETTAPPKKGKSRGKHRKLEKAEKKDQGMPTFPPIYQQLKAIGSELDQEIFDHDGAADRPGGAIVSLVIGVSLTAVLAIWIGCRMKTVGRRLRRTGKPYAHDADFLVNGMYL